MKFITFNPFRTLGIPNVTYVKPENMFKEIEKIIVFVGDNVICAYWRIAPEGGFHNNIAKGASYDFDNIPNAAVSLVENVVRSLKINHAGFDVAVVKDKLYILEFNVMFGNEGLRKMKVQVGKYIYEYITSNPEFNPNNPNNPILPKAS